MCNMLMVIVLIFFFQNVTQEINPKDDKYSTMYETTIYKSIRKTISSQRVIYRAFTNISKGEICLRSESGNSFN